MTETDFAGKLTSRDSSSVGNAPRSPIKMSVWAYRVVHLGILLSVLWKVEFFNWSLIVYRAIPLEDPFFPELLRSTGSLTTSYILAVGASFLAIFARGGLTKRCLSWISLIGLTILCLHQGSYNDATFTTSWWAAIWSVWFANRMTIDTDEELIPKAAWLSRTIISMILLGGAVGKWTNGYWSGEVLYDIYFVDRDFWLFNELRSTYDMDALKEISRWYSRTVVVIETLAGFGLWLLPARTASVVAIVLLTSIVAFSNFLLLSVIFSLLGLAAVGLFPGHCSDQ